LSDKILLSLTFDTDADPADSLQNPTWNNLRNLSSFFVELRRWFQQFKQKPKTTWFVRVDNQVEAVYGQRDGLLTAYEKYWKEIVADGGEIGLHPHLYEKKSNTFRRAHGEACLNSELQKNLECALEWKTFSIRSSRVGEAYHNNDLMKILADNGKISQDCTAMSGRVVNAELKLNWENTPRTPYFPSTSDYRRPGEPHLNILEIPMTMVKTRASYDANDYSRYLNPAFHEQTFKDLKADIGQVDYIMTVTHLFELYSDTKEQHGLLSYNVQNYFKVLSSLVKIITGLGKKIEFATANKLGNHFRNA
jgi:hypothetical protein